MLTFVIGTKRLCPVVATLTVGKMVEMEQKKYLLKTYLWMMAPLLIAT